MFKIIFLKNERNDATDYYTHIIKEALEKSGEVVEITSDIKNIAKSDKVLTISLKAFLFVWLRNPKQFIIHWFQGVTPEEARLLFSGSIIQRNLRWIYLSFFEKFVLLFSKFNFFVSNSMLEHYKRKYNYVKKNYMIMPCYNLKLNKQAFYNDKYKTPNFLYAGSLASWQCIEEVLSIFREINKIYPNANLYFYTAEKEKAKDLIEEFKIKNVWIDYVSYEELNNKIHEFKYGFLIRDDILVNNVATPTKMNSYLANGVIPIYSNIIHDFFEKINGEYLIPVSGNSDAVNKIVDFESREVDFKNILTEYEKYFMDYYCDEKYLSEMVEKFKIYDVVKNEN
ncbi:hypothetical protein [Acinetobacter ursingii]|uniref:hypothetical protein n=1 Tax=Acinetobacter ursingii TaxID=108980 RepID=UPI0005CA1C36|nr:hypothetical protein [Acinetobacter ursingii]